MQDTVCAGSDIQQENARMAGVLKNKLVSRYVVQYASLASENRRAVRVDFVVFYLTWTISPDPREK